jgi:NitT/TauT family transport system permease protein
MMKEDTKTLELVDDVPRWRGSDPVNFLVPLVFVVIIVIWELAVRLSGVPAYIWPAPSNVAAALFRGIADGVYLPQLWITFREAAGGFLIAAVLGIVLGSVIAQFRLLERTLSPYLIALQTTPKIAIAPLFVMWLGFGLSSKITVAAMVAFFPVFVNVVVGLRTVEGEKLALMRSMGASRWQIWRFILFPNALPFIFAGLNIAMVFSITGAIVGEFVGSRSGIGNLILQMNFNLDTGGVFAALFCLALMGVALHLLIQWLQRRIVFWSEPDHPIGT